MELLFDGCGWKGWSSALQSNLMCSCGFNKVRDCNYRVKASIAVKEA